MNALSLLTLFSGTFIISLSGALMPGPLLSVAITESSGPVGWKSGPLLVAGHGFLEILLILLLFTGLRPLFDHPLFFPIVGFSGSAFMVWMAIGMFKSLKTLTLSGEERKSRRFLPLDGALMSLANPYWTIWWATIGLGYILGAAEWGFAGVAVFFLGHISADLGWYTIISVGIAKGKKFIPDKVYRILVACCAAFLTGYACLLIVKSIQNITKL